MKYKLLKQIEEKDSIKVWSIFDIWDHRSTLDIDIPECQVPINFLISQWYIEEVKEPKTIYDLKDGDNYYYLNNNQIKVLMQSRWDWEFSHDANVYIFLTEREAKRNKLLRELATRTDKWLPDEREFYTTYNDYMNACKVHWNWKACDMIQYHMWLVFRNEKEYNKYLTEEAKDLLFNI